MTHPSPPPEALPPGRVAIILKGWPRLSETFIAQEILALQQAGLDFELVSLRHPTDTKTHPIHDAVTAPVTYLPEYLHLAPLRVLRAWWQVRRRPGYRLARRQWLRDLRRDPTRNRIRRFGQACVLAAEIAPRVASLYAHFMHTPGSVARYASIMADVPYALSAHARDIWTIPDWEKREKLADCVWLTTCTATNVRHLQGLAVTPERVFLMYHGLDLSRFAAVPRPAAAADASGPVRLVSVGRLVAKKGYDTLLAALALLPPEVDWHFEHIGGGPLKETLKAQAAALGLTERITWRGAQAQTAVIEAYRAAEIFVLASRIDADGDRDGLPNVLMEAASQGLCCVSTEVSAIPEFITHDESGLLVPPEDPAALAAALTRVLSDAPLRQRFAAAIEVRVRTQFEFSVQIQPLLARFGLKAPAAIPAAPSAPPLAAQA